MEGESEMGTMRSTAYAHRHQLRSNQTPAESRRPTPPEKALVFISGKSFFSVEFFLIALPFDERTANIGFHDKYAQRHQLKSHIYHGTIWGKSLIQGAVDTPDYTPAVESA